MISLEKFEKLRSNTFTRILAYIQSYNSRSWIKTVLAHYRSKTHLDSNWPLGTVFFLELFRVFFSGLYQIRADSHSSEVVVSSVSRKSSSIFCPAHKSEGEIRCVVVYTLYYNMVGVQYSKVAPFQEMLTEITKKAAYRCTTWWADVHGGSGCRVHNRRPKHRRQRRTSEAAAVAT